MSMDKKSVSINKHHTSSIGSSLQGSINQSKLKNNPSTTNQEEPHMSQDMGGIDIIVTNDMKQDAEAERVSN